MFMRALYCVKVKVTLGGMGGELETDLPFKLVHPRPDSEVGHHIHADIRTKGLLEIAAARHMT